MRKLQDVLRKHILAEALDPVAVVELEKAIALLDEQRADGYCELRPERPPESALPHLGILRRLAELAQRCFIEQYSQTTTSDEVDDALRKLLLFHYGLKKAAKGERKKPVKGASVPKPVLWIVSPGRPRQVLADYGARPAPDWPPGFYRCPPGLALWIVVLAELPKTAETRALRMFGKPAMQLEVLRELRALPLADPQHAPWIDILADVRYLIEQVPARGPEEQRIMTELRQRWELEKTQLRTAAKAEGIAEGIAKGRQRWELEKTQLHTAAKAEGIAEGIAKGKAEGIAKGKAEGKADSVLTMMTARGLRVSDAVRVRVLGCHDLGMLDRWLVRAATAASDAEVIVS